MVSVPPAPLMKRPAPAVPACELRTMCPLAQVALPWLTKLRPSSRKMALLVPPISVVVPDTTVLPLPTIEPACQENAPSKVSLALPEMNPPFMRKRLETAWSSLTSSLAASRRSKPLPVTSPASVKVPLFSSSEKFGSAPSMTPARVPPMRACT